MVEINVQGTWKIVPRFDETERTDTMRCLDFEGIKNIPKDRVVTYARIMVDYRPLKADPNRVRITAGGNLLQYP